MLQSAAWKSLSANARAIYIEISQRYAGPGSNNGRIPYSIGEACRALKIGRATAWRVFKELIEKGFLVVVTPGAFSLKHRHATEWRLTEFPCDVTDAMATKDFMRWSGKIQNASSVAELTVPSQNPRKSYNGTVVAKTTRDRF
jgi:hypothetical protein